MIDSLLAHHFIWPLAFVPFMLFLVLVIVGSSNARESYGWTGRARDRLRAGFLRGADGADLHFEPRAFCGVSGDSEESRTRAIW